MEPWNYLKWAEHAGMEHLREQLAVGDFLHHQANTCLALLMAGMGVALGPVLMGMDGAAAFTALQWACLGALVYMGTVAVNLLVRCIVTRETWPLYNHPGNIYKPELGLGEDDVRGFELRHVIARIDLTEARNARVAQMLDVCRYATLATPLVALACAQIHRL